MCGSDCRCRRPLHQCRQVEVAVATCAVQLQALLGAGGSGAAPGFVLSGERPSQMRSSVGIQETARWQFYKRESQGMKGTLEQLLD